MHRFHKKFQLQWLRFIFSPLMVFLLMQPQAQASDYLNIYGGRYDISQKDNPANQYGLEYRYEDIFHGLRPGLGINMTSDHAVYGYGGFFWDMHLTEGLVFTPNVVAGAYRNGHGKDLGHAVEFRSGLELSYEFPNKNRLGVAFNHISNASLGDHNPGAETLLFLYEHPINLLSEPEHIQKQRWWQQPPPPVPVLAQ